MEGGILVCVIHVITASCSDRWGSFYVQFISAPTVSCASYLDLFLDLCSDAFFQNVFPWVTDSQMDISMD